MIGFKLFVASVCLALASSVEAQQEYRPAPLRIGTGNADLKPTPVPILKQINRHNEDGSYTYGYEGADGSFKIETKLATGEVKGKYGYVDESGKVKVVEYGANKYGFQPSGEGITVPPPTLVDETTGKDGLLDYEDNVPAPRLQQLRPSKPRYQEVPQQRPQPQPQPQYYDYEEEQHQPQPQHQPRLQPQQQQQLHHHQQPQQQQAQYVQHSHFGPSAPAPVPARAHLSNAVPVDVVYSPKQRPARPEPEYDTRPQTFPNAAPAPEPKIRFSAPAFAAAAQAPLPKSNPIFAPAQPEYAPQPRPAPAVYQPRPAQGRSTSILDQLAKDFALPQGGAPPLHDITFGYY
ncbi:tyrosine-protein phosphatase non-receptor type 23 isoform X2 [Uranotaenia lowii]|uniref:tyrosine-protein phosphatase non-receptor type 23 isoform X2 n=1 Tax=Uranotaenia lowii TaxID=190385 RepID=UPI00247B0848|nr:tyrosine-protein phosphatase non-receptor type 23 isoform X2 [Uranotaenia lowii]